MPMRREDKERSKYSKYKARVDLTKNRTSSERARVARSLAGVPLGGCTRSCPLACTCVGFACVFGRHESRVVTVVTMNDRQILPIWLLAHRSSMGSAQLVHEGSTDLAY